MKLLIVTQVVDKNDPVLGFFHHWLEEFSKHFDSIQVICLKKGEYRLPPNVIVHSLGKEKTPSTINDMIYHIIYRVQYAWRFLKLVYGLRKEYDAVFVHMNPEYLALTGLDWRLMRKKIALWYTHKSVDMKLRIAEWFADIVFTASKESFRLASKKVRVMGHGIDTDYWTPDEHSMRASDLLSVGRLMPTKRHDLAIRLAHEEGVSLRIAGEGPERERLEALAQELQASVVFLGPCTEETLREEYRRAARLVHRSETGSLDKVVLEAASCGCLVDSTDPAISALPLTREYVRTHHSLASLIPRIKQAYESL